MRTDGGTAAAAVQAGLAALTAVDVAGLPDGQVRTEVLSLLGCLNQLTAALADRIASFDTRDLAHGDGQRVTSTWLVGYGRMSKGAALRWVAHGRCLQQLPAVADGMRAGTVSAEQLAKIADLIRQLGVAKVRPYDTILARLCAQSGPRQVEQACARILALEDPDGAEPDPDADLRRREIVFSQLGSMLYLRGRLDPEGAAVLQSAIDALMRPPTSFDERSTGQRRADALVDLAKAALASTTLPEVGGERPHVGILLTPELLFGTPQTPPTGPAPATTATTGNCPQQTAPPPGGTTTVPAAHVGEPDGEGGADLLTQAGVPALAERPWLTWAGHVSPELAARLACDSIIWRLVLDPRTGLPLDVGRRHRIVPPWIRRALWARDRTCRWPGCDLPAAWTDAHHIIGWWRGGTTTIDQLISLCRYHHGLVHEGRWQLHLDHTTGDVSITRPDGTPYELGPSQPWTTPSRQGPPHTSNPPPDQDPPQTTHPPWSSAA